MHISYALLPDKGYSINDIRTNASLPFVANDSLRPYNTPFLWLKVIITRLEQAHGQYVLRVKPYLDNSFYSFNPYTQQWAGKQTGAYVPGSDALALYSTMVIVVRPVKVVGRSPKLHTT